MGKHVRMLVALVVLLWAVPAGRAAAGEDPWAAYRFLIGEWVGEGSAGSGQFSLTPDLQGKVLVRKNHAEYPAAGNRPAIKHDDLLVIYRGHDGKRNRAVYFDSEDHVIQYTISPSEDGRSLTFLSEAMPSTPRFRLIYTKGASEDQIQVKFEIAPPGKPDAFKTYLEGSSRRKGHTSTGTVKERK